METTELKDGGLLCYDDSFLSPELADRYFTDLRDQCQWEQKPGIFGHMQPRLIASYGDAGVTYRYSGMDYAALPWTTTLLEIKVKIEAVQGEYNYCLLNRYRSGTDSMGIDRIQKLDSLSSKPVSRSQRSIFHFWCDGIDLDVTTIG